MHERLKKCIGKVEFGENLATGGALENVVNVGNRGAIFNRDTVEAAKIAEEPEFAIFFLNEESRGGPRGTGWTEAACGTVFLDFLSKGVAPR